MDVSSKKGSISDLWASVQVYLSLLKKYIDQFGADFKIYGVYIASCNFAAIFQYGSIDAVSPSKCSRSQFEEDEY